jgi:hypothetical protein
MLEMIEEGRSKDGKAERTKRTFIFLDTGILVIRWRVLRPLLVGFEKEEKRILLESRV